MGLVIDKFNAEKLPSIRDWQPCKQLQRGKGLGAIAIAGLAASGLSMAIAAPAAAHGAHIQYEVISRPSGPVTRVSARYDSNEPMAAAQVSIYSPEQPNKPWVTGQTDAEGYFEFAPNQQGAWDIKVRQAGHGALVTMEWPPETQLASKDVIALGGSVSVQNSGSAGLPPWLGLGLGVAVCLGGAWFLMRRSPQSGGVEVAD
ncbi:MAG: hypothetical protein AAF889_07200 [Cyanobacteria bacterium P01_D01_bin.73]